MHLISKILIILVFAIAYFFIGWINYSALIEAYGSDRTTNMDKWESPVLMLVAIDIGILLISYISFLIYKILLNKKTEQGGPTVS
jgi:hypothetical protein